MKRIGISNVALSSLVMSKRISVQKAMLVDLHQFVLKILFPRVIVIFCDPEFDRPSAICGETTYAFDGGQCGRILPHTFAMFSRP